MLSDFEQVHITNSRDVPKFHVSLCIGLLCYIWCKSGDVEVMAVGAKVWKLTPEDS